MIDAGATGVGLESTVLDCSSLCTREGVDKSVQAKGTTGGAQGGQGLSLPVLTILRPGGVTLEQLVVLVGTEATVELDRGLERGQQNQKPGEEKEEVEDKSED